MATILDIANADRNLFMMIKGIRKSSLNDKLRGPGPFTLLAPINLAFRNLTYPDNVETLLSESGSNKRISDIINCHILLVKKLIKDFRDGQKIKTANGKDVHVTVKEDDVYINGAKILARDMQGSNGVIHSIDSVIFPQ
jgi:uncharacterized surface protein with fasciclin (FAS1) repeats